jgi:hypothetical protein
VPSIEPWRVGTPATEPSRWVKSASVVSSASNGTVQAALK